MALFDDASLVTTPNGYKAGTLYSIKPTSGAGDMTVVRATTATRVNSAGLIESMANNVPRLDYLNASCPSLLVEPQRTNYFPYSENISAWYEPDDGVTLTSNTTDTASPDGTNNASKITIVGGNQRNFQITNSVSGVGTFSAYVKAGTSSTLALYTSSASLLIGYNLSTLAVTQTTGTGTITSVGNGWYRITATNTLGANEVLQVLYTGTAGQTIYIWGFQVEAGSYLTSYIPTTSASVTRNADVISKTGISSLIGQTEGVLFLDFVYNELDTNGMIPITIGTNTANHAYLYIDGNNKVYFDFVSGNLISCSISTATNFAVKGTRYKMAFAYKANDFTFYINGNQIGSDSSGSIASFSNLFMYYPYGSGYSGDQNINVSALFPTRLTNAELASLTTI